MVKKLAQEDVHLDFWRDGYRKIATKVKQPTGFQKIVTLAMRSASVLDGNCRSLETAGHCCPMSVASMTMKAQSQRLSRVISENNGLVLRKAAVEPPTITEGGGVGQCSVKIWGIQSYVLLSDNGHHASHNNYSNEKKGNPLPECLVAKT